MKATYKGTTEPTRAEAKGGAEIVFLYKDQYNNIVRVKACKCYESWEQWGAITDILSLNVNRVESWRNKQDNNF